VEWAHAIAPNAKILLVEANSDNGELINAVNWARNQPDVVSVSMSWGFNEFQDGTGLDFLFQPAPFANPLCCFFAGAGDNCNMSWPASSPNVVSVGGTTLNFTNGLLYSETVWYNGTTNGTPMGTSGGVSKYEQEPSYQSTYGVPNANEGRCVPDVSFDADPIKSGVSLYFNYSNTSKWVQAGGTSLGAPCWAAIHSIDLTASNSNLYIDAKIGQVNQTRFRDITAGWNGVYNATAGYDFCTGLGSPLTTNYSVPLFAMKTLTDGKFYNPKQSFQDVKVEEWFTDNRSEGDQTGQNVTGYPFWFPDKKVGLSDLVTLAEAYGSNESTSRWNYQTDIMDTGTIGLSDLVTMATHWNSSKASPWYTKDISHISINFTITGDPQPVTEGVDSNGFTTVPANCTGWIVFRNDTNTAVGAFLTFWG
jgi:hypothetical protein